MPLTARRMRLKLNLERTRFSSISTASCRHVTPTTAACTVFCCSRSMTLYNSVCLELAPPRAKRSNSSNTNTTARSALSNTRSTSRMNATFSMNPAARLNSSSSPARHSCAAISRMPTFSSECNIPERRTVMIRSPCASRSCLSAESNTSVLPLPLAPTRSTELFCPPVTVSPRISTRCD